MSLMAFGGWGTALSLVERLRVSEAGWVSPQDFAAAVACGCVTQGLVLITATPVGYRATGLSGAVVATVQLDIFHRHGRHAIGAIKEVGIVSRPARDEQEILLWAFQGRDGRLRVML